MQGSSLEGKERERSSLKGESKIRLFMKKNRNVILLILTAAAVLVSCLFVGCDFVQYVKKPENGQVATEEIIALRDEYANRLEQSLPAPDAYRDKEQKLYLRALQDAVNELNECFTEAELKEVYDKHFGEISKIKTDGEYAAEEAAHALEVHRQDIIGKLNDYIDFDLYRNEQVEELKAILQEHLALAELAENIAAVDNAFREYKIATYGVPTDEYLYGEELAELKESLSAALNDAYKLSLYRENERTTVQTLLQSFEESLKKVAKKEDALSLYIIARTAADAIKTDVLLSEEERLRFLEALKKEMISEINANVPERDRYVYLERADEVYARMCDIISTQGIYEIYIDFASEFSPKAIKEAWARYNSHVAYRDEQLKEVQALKERYSAALDKTASSAEALAVFNEAKEALAKIKTNDELWADSLENFRSALRGLYGEAVLEEPASLTEASDYFELAKIIDYFAFYQLSATEFACGKFRVKLNFAHGDAQEAINSVYWNCELLRSGAGIYGEFEDKHYLALTLVPYNLASRSNRETTSAINKYASLIEYASENQTTARGESFDDFAYKNYGREIGGIWYTQQLWYSLEHGYVPVCIPSSPAERVLSRAKEILREIVKEGMTNDEKTFAVYSWFARNVQYDYKYTQGFEQSVLEKYPEAATWAAFHAEGALLDGLAVCEGYAKGYLLLLRIEGIESYRIVKSPANAGIIIPDAGGEKYYAGSGYGSHSFVGVKMSDGYLYYSDSEASFAGSGGQLHTYQQYMVPSTLFVGYGGKTFLKPQIDEGYKAWSGYKNLSVDGLSLYVKNRQELETLAARITELFAGGSALCVSVFCDVQEYPSFLDDVLELLNFDYIVKRSVNPKCDFYEYIFYK